MEVDVLKLLKALLNKWMVILATVAVAVIAAFVITKFFITPMYRSETSIYVRPGNSAITNTEVTVARDLVSTFEALMDSNTVMQDVVDNIADKTNHTYTLSQIRKMKKAAGVNDTELMKVTITCADPEDAQIIADQLIASAQPVIVNSIRAEAFYIVDYATLPRSPVSPDIKRNMLIGGLAGFVLSAGVIILITLFDKRIKDQTTLSQTIQAPVIGVIPSMD